LLTALGEPTPARRWLAASLEKTIRLQLDPPADVIAQMTTLGLGSLNDTERWIASSAPSNAVRN
jgi:hypothetical protein